MEVRNLNTKRAVLGLALAAVCAVAAAAVTFDPASGTGFVGKGDVQLAYGWNNKALQDNARFIGFTYEATTGWGYVCEWWTGPSHNRTHHDVTKKVGIAVASTITYDARQRNQITGFMLNGFAGPGYDIGADDVPQVGDGCLGNGTNAQVTEVFRNPALDEGGLYVTFNGSKVLLPTPSF